MEKLLIGFVVAVVFCMYMFSSTISQLTPLVMNPQVQIAGIEANRDITIEQIHAETTKYTSPAYSLYTVVQSGTMFFWVIVFLGGGIALLIVYNMFKSPMY